MQSDTPEEDNAPIDLPASTAPENIALTVSGFDTEARAREVATAVSTAIRGIGRVIDVSDLDGVTIAYDYDAALTNLDRGLNAPSTLTRTSNSRIRGVAMAPAVLRDGVVKSHLVINGDFASQVLSENLEEAQTALYLIAHECGHIEDRMLFDRQLPGILLRYRIPEGLDQILHPWSETLWMEYAACVASARFNREHIGFYIDGVIRSAETVRADVAAMILRYRIHADLNRLLAEAGPRLCEPLFLAAYLLGHLDGLGDEWEEAADARDALRRSGYWPIVERTADNLRHLLQTRSDWQDLSVFDPLKDRVRDAFALNGMFLSELPNGSAYIDIP